MDYRKIACVDLNTICMNKEYGGLEVRLLLGNMASRDKSHNDQQERKHKSIHVGDTHRD